MYQPTHKVEPQAVLKEFAPEFVPESAPMTNVKRPLFSQIEYVQGTGLQTQTKYQTPMSDWRPTASNLQIPPPIQSFVVCQEESFVVDQEESCKRQRTSVPIVDDEFFNFDIFFDRLKDNNLDLLSYTDSSSSSISHDPLGFDDIITDEEYMLLMEG